MSESNGHVVIKIVRAASAGVADIALALTGSGNHSSGVGAVSCSCNIRINKAVVTCRAGVSGKALSSTGGSGHGISVSVSLLFHRLGLDLSALTRKGLYSRLRTGRLESYCALVPRVVMSVSVKLDGLISRFTTVKTGERLDTVGVDRGKSRYFSLTPGMT